jgi:hypothetical protein
MHIIHPDNALHETTPGQSVMAVEGSIRCARGVFDVGEKRVSDQKNQDILWSICIAGEYDEF